MITSKESDEIDNINMIKDNDLWRHENKKLKVKNFISRNKNQ